MKRISITFVILFVSNLLLFTITGCGGGGDDKKEDTKKAANSEKLQTARELLQKSKPQEAIDLLIDEQDPEANYLKAVSFYRMGKTPLATRHVDDAVKADAGKPKYKAFQLRLQLASRRLKAADELIELRSQETTDPAVAFFAFYAYQAKRLLLAASKEGAKAQQMNELGLRALRDSIDLCAGIPELQREMLEQAINFGLSKEAQQMVTRLQKVSPKDPSLSLQSIQTAILARQQEDTFSRAKQYYEEQGKSAQAAQIYARALTQVLATSERDAEFSALRDDHPQNPDLVMLHAIYLTRSSRLPLACEVISAAIPKFQKEDDRKQLMWVGIDIPLRERETKIAESQLEQYRVALDDPLLVKYFEARLLYLKGEHLAALQNLRYVLEAQKKDVGSSRKLAHEALTWMQKILTDKTSADLLDKASKIVKGGEKTPPEKQPEEPEKNPASKESPTDKPENKQPEQQKP